METLAKWKSPKENRIIVNESAFALGLARPSDLRTAPELSVKTVLIVDADLGFVFWLGQVLRVAGYAVLPAQSVPGAAALLAECNLAVDVLIVEPSLPGASDLVAALRHDRENVKVVAVSEGAAPDGSQLEADAACEKPVETSEECLFEWTRMMRRTLVELGGSTHGFFPRKARTNPSPAGGRRGGPRRARPDWQ